MKYIKAITLLTTILGSLCYANPPLRIGNQKTLGRLTYFQSNEEFSYFLPSAFNPELECLPQGDKKLRCVLKIINDLNSSESKLLEEIGPSTALSDLSYNIVTSIDELLTPIEALTEIQASKIMYTKTLRLSPAPYVLTSFVLTKEKGISILNSFKTSGIGSYKVKINLNASDTSFYLAIKNTKELRERLLTLEGRKIKSWNISTVLKELLNGLEIKAIGYDDPKSILIDILRVKYFSKTGVATYQVRTDMVRDINDVVEVYLDDTTDGNPYLCEVILILKENALPTTKCFERE